MKPSKRILALSVLAVFITLKISAQLTEVRYAIGTTLDGKTPIAFEENYAALKFNPSTGDLTFQTNLADLKTGNNQIDSALNEEKILLFSFKGNAGTNLFQTIYEENDDAFHKVQGTITVNGISYKAEAFIKLENLSDKSNLAKLYVDFKMIIDPKVIIIPCLSSYFNNLLLIQINDGLVSQTI